MQLLTTALDLAPAAGGTFVPTMGALHDGHLELIRTAAAQGGPVVVSIFVNPTQFTDSGDLDRYPRTLDQDRDAAAAAGADFIFAPAVDVIYPPDSPIPVPPLPDVAFRPRLEDAERPGHFDGVCQVVSRLFDLVQPRLAFFGEKDFQQICVIRAMVNGCPERWEGLEIVGCPTVREPDGLARSSRNTQLRDSSRADAVGLFRALSEAAEIVRADPSIAPSVVQDRMVRTLEGHNLDVDYAAVREPHNLRPIKDFTSPARALIAARTGGVRLIDNAAIPAGP